MAEYYDGIPQALFKADVDDTPVDGATTVPPSSNWAFDHAADLETHTKDMHEILITGQYHMMDYGALTNLSLAADQLEAVPFIVSRDMTVDRIAIIIQASGAGGTKVRLGIYEGGTNLYPGALLLPAGLVDADSTGIKAITINQALTKGLYWLAYLTDGAPALRASHSSLFSPLGLNADFLYVNSHWRVARSYGTLPDPFTAGGALQKQNRGHIALRIASLD